MKPVTEQAPRQEEREAPAQKPRPEAAAARPAVLRLVLVAALFLGWLGYLAYLVWTLPPGGSDHRPPLLSRPQLLISPLDVIGVVEGLERPVLVEEVLYPTSADAPRLAGTKVVVTNLDDCRQAVLGPDGRPQPDYTGPGRYLLPLRPLPDGGYEVVRIPPSPGYPFNGPPRIYPATPDILSQHKQVAKPPRATPES